jgi:N-acetylglucosaminyldiphosphoundecaprenol N-acetyl-beta-D-mannosaminyltransferase
VTEALGKDVCEEPVRYEVLNSRICALDLSQAVDRIDQWIREGSREYMSVCTSDTVLKCRDNETLAQVVNNSGMAVPDGMPLVWLGKWGGHSVSRVYGPDLMLSVCERGLAEGYRHFFYGGTPRVLSDLQEHLSSRFPGIRIVGDYAPPFRPLSDDEEESVAARINAAKPDVVWVGLGTPKQDYWVASFRSRLDASVLIPVGAAFDFHSGHTAQAPRWMMTVGLEWLFRLCSEPKRLWRRYIIGNPRFIYHVFLQWCRRRLPSARSETEMQNAQEGHADAAGRSAPRVNVLGVAVNTVYMDQAVRAIVDAGSQRTGGYVCVTGVHGIIESQGDRALRQIHNRSLMTVPDGMPTVWMGRHRGFQKMSRVYGPDLMLNVCRASVDTALERPLSHFLYGSTPEVLAKLKTNLENMVHGIRIAGVYSPPFRPLTSDEERELQRKVSECAPDFFWVGLSTPKQERFMAAHSSQMPHTVMLGVGAAFDLHAGLREDSPDWMKRSGLQWFHRLCQEPRRLWRRYLHIVPTFLFLILLQAIGVKRFPVDCEDVK